MITFVRIGLVAKVLIFSSFTAHAGNDVDDIRALLEVGDIAALESKVQELDQLARDDGKFDVLRLVHSQLFKTSSPQWQDTIARWAETNPTSKYAATAKAWASIKALELMAPSGEFFEAPKAAALADEWSEKFGNALGDTLEAVEIANASYVPALDAWFRAFSIQPKITEYFAIKDDLLRLPDRRDEVAPSDWEAFNEHNNQLLALAPDRQSALVILRSGLLGSPRPSQKAIELCINLGTRIVGYDANQCLVEASTIRDLGRDLKQAVGIALKDYRGPLFARAWLDDLLWQGVPDPANYQEALALHQGILESTDDFEKYLIEARMIARMGQNPAYFEEARENAVTRIDEMLADDPLNGQFIRTKIEALLQEYMREPDPDKLRLAKSVWEQIIETRETDYYLWYLGAHLARVGHPVEDYTAQLPFWENAIAHSQQALTPMLEHFYLLGLARDAIKNADTENSSEMNAAMEGLKCPMLRAARLSSALCSAQTMRSSICDPAKPFYSQVPEILQLGEDGWCPEVMDISLSSLAYSPTPYSSLRDIWGTGEQK